MASAETLIGVFKKGQWYCECQPRLPAVRRQVKKDGDNKGRFFIVCERPRSAWCNFFLWEDDAKAREPGELRNTSGSEPDSPTVKKKQYRQQHIVPGNDGLRLGHRSGSEDDSSGTEGASGPDSPTVRKRSGLRRSLRTPEPHDTRGARRSPAPVTTPPARKQVQFASPVTTPSVKRTRDVFERSDDTESFSDLDSDTERQVSTLVEQISRTQGGSKAKGMGHATAADDVGTFQTPVAQRTQNMFAGGLPTPDSRNSLLVVSEQKDAKRQKSDVTSKEKAEDDYDITEEVMTLMEGQPLEEPVRQAVRSTLNRHALRMAGVFRGREMARSVVKAKDARIAELQERVLQLEAVKTADRQRMQKVKAGLLNLYQDDGEDDD